MINNKYYLNCICFGRAAEGLRADLQKQLIEMQNEIGFKYVRFHGIFHDDMAVYHEENGTPALWFGYIDELFDFLLKNNLKPILELSFMPKDLASSNKTLFWWNAHTCPPNDYNKWCFLIQGTVSHLIARYGIEEVKTWYFEIWNEPNLDSFWHGTQSEYFKLYETSVTALKSVCDCLKVGGPSVSGADFREDLNYLKAFIAFCEKKKLPVDFFTAHPYPTYWPLDTNGNEKMGYMGKDICTEFLSNLNRIIDHSVYKGAEIHLTEWNSSPSPRDLVHDTPFKAPFILYNVTQNFSKADSLCYWAISDIFEENGPGTQPFHGGFGLINTNGIKKPAYWAYVFLSKLGTEILKITDNCIITKENCNYRMIFWNYCYYKPEFADGNRSGLSLTMRDGVFESKTEKISLSIDLNGTYRQTVYTINEETSAFHNWVKAGAPQYPTQNLIDKIGSTSRPKEENRIVSAVCIKEELKPHEVKMYLFDKI